MKKVVLVSGKLRSGKNQFAEYLEESYIADNVSVVQDCFAQYLKDECKNDFKPLVKYLNNVADEILSCIPIDDQEPEIMSTLMKLRTQDENFYENKNGITRILLQLYGTDIFRKRVDSDYWVKRMINKIKESENEVFIITDVRFPNEINMLCDESDFDVTSIRVERDIDRSGSENEHTSETALDNFKEFTYIIDNNGTLEDLWNAMDVVYDELKNGIDVNEQHEYTY